MGSWTHPISKDKIKFVMFIDEGSRFRVGKILYENTRNQATWPVMKRHFEESWVSTFGFPEEIRVDPEGIWRGEEPAQYCQERGIILSPIPAEAHWQIGVVEESIGAAKSVMESLAHEFPDMSISECFFRSIWACNSRDNQFGYSPAQHAMGRTPDEWGRLFEGKVTEHPIHAQQMIDGGFAENIKAMAIAEQSFSRHQATVRLERAKAAGGRPLKSFVPGDLVFYWRKQVQGGQGKGFSWRGQFLGPARVLAVETREDEQGRLRPGSCIWLHRSGRLIKAAPEQLRAATSRERAVEELKGPCEIPWTITSLATHPQRSTFWDISMDIPSDLQWQEASEAPPPQKDHPTGGRRFFSKRSLSEDVHRRSRPRIVSPDAEIAGTDDILLTSDNANDSHVVHTAVEIEVELPSSRRGVRRFFDQPEAYVVSQLKKDTVEVKERFLTDFELEQFRAAKDKEVRSYIQSHCFKILPPEFQDRSKAVGMRWVLTWKVGEDTDSRKAKARAVILGYQDRDYEYKQTTSPTLSRSGRQLFLAFCARRHFKVRKGDVSSAFLQGDALENGMLVQPTPEICRAMGIPDASITQLQRAAYGLVEAPLWWYKSVSKFLASIGYTRMRTEPGIWVYFDEQHEPRSIICGHVDDFLFGGSDDDNIHNSLMAKIKEKFQWGTWEDPPFTQCGVRISQDQHFGFTLHQKDFVDSIQKIYLSKERYRQRDDATTDKEKSQLRAALWTDRCTTLFGC